MKSEERHQLQETELEKWGRQAQNFWETFLKDHAKTVLIAVAAVVVIVGGVAWWLGSSSAADAERWQEVISASFDSDSAKSIEQFGVTADRFPNHPAGQWAALMEAERSLSAGIQYARTNRKSAISELLQAREAFGKLKDAKSELLQERRLFGLARCLETLAGVDVSGEKDGENVIGLEEAVKAYEQFVQTYPASIFTAMAEERIAALKSDQAQDFYAWYRDQNPNPDDIKTPADGQLPPGHPPVSPSLPGTSIGTTPSDSDDAMMFELENMVKGAKPEEKAPDFPENIEPKDGPSLTPPKTEDKKPEDPAPKTEEPKSDGPSLTPPKTEEADPKPEAEKPSAPETPEDKKPEDPAPAKPEEAAKDNPEA